MSTRGRGDKNSPELHVELSEEALALVLPEPRGVRDAHMRAVVQQLEKTVAEKEELLAKVRAELANDKKHHEESLDDLATQMSTLQLERDGAFKRSRQLQERSDTLNTTNLDLEISLRERVVTRSRT